MLKSLFISFQAMLWIGLVSGSVIFPFQQDSVKSRRRKFFTGDEMAGGIIMKNRASSQVSHPTKYGHYGMINTFSTVGRNGGTLLLFGAALIQIGNIVTSESVRRAVYFWINAGPMVCHYKFTQWYLTKTDAPLEKRDKVYNSLHNRYCQKAFGIILHLKGLYVKIAQIISSRPDFVPPQYIDLFMNAQDSIPQWPIEEVISILNRSLHTEFGLCFDDVFQSIDPISLGSASIGQVHRAKIKPEVCQGDAYKGGTDVAVKIMHPNAEFKFDHDFQVFRWLCKLALKGWEPVLNELHRQIMSEFDFRRETASLEAVRDNMANSPFKRRIRIPEPLSALCTKEVLVMEMLDGKKLSEALEDELAVALDSTEKATALLKRKRLELILGKENLNTLDKSEILNVKELGLWKKVRLYSLYKKAQNYIDLLIDVQGHQILCNGVFNGDPHPGNILQMPDGTLGLIDYGQTKKLTKEERLGIARVVVAIGKKLGEKEIANRMREIGFQTKFNSDKVLAKYAALFFDSDTEGKLSGCSTPQLYFAKLTTEDPLSNVPDAAIFVARASFILRGVGTLLDKQVGTSDRWIPQAEEALKEAI